MVSERLEPKHIVLPKRKEEVEERARNVYYRYGFPQCIGAADGAHIKSKRPVDNPTDYVDWKGNFTLIVKEQQLDTTIVLFYVLIKWPGSVHNARMFGNSALNGMFRDGTIPKCERIIVEG